MSTDLELRGVLAATVTPFDAESRVDVEALGRLAEYLIAGGISGFVPCGSSGEFSSLSGTERRHVVESLIALSSGRVPVVPHTGALTTAESVALSRHADEAGASAVMVVPPFYDVPSWPEIQRHYHAIADSIDIPVVIYNIPSATKIGLSPAQLAELAKIPNVRYVKDSSGDASALTELVQRYGDVLTTLNGWDSLTFYGFLAGTQACIWGAANFMPAACVELYENCVVHSDLKAARARWQTVWPICNFLETHSYIAGVKAACDIVGVSAGDPRAPFLPLAGPERAELEDLLKAAGIVGS